ncbi:MAG: fructosamine kinase family protein [Gammaproteobacteria bacterium]|nr:fructosamine kinase family protein [Gammaproteobacteria bacterium]
MWSEPRANPASSRRTGGERGLKAVEPSRGLTAIAVESACRAIGLDFADVLSARPVGGGCINQGTALRTTRGDFFLKWNRQADHRFFGVESEGLETLAASGSVRVPSVIAASGPGDEVAWLLLEWIEEGRPDRRSWIRLGRELAALHRGADPGGPDARFGWSGDNLIGSLPQPNGWSDDWAGFWAERRIRPLARELRERGALSAAQANIVEAVARRAGELVSPAAAADGPSLLHGDLWSGNVLFARGGAPVLIDPAVYVGHREVDLAMADLFGGFSGAFREAYEDAWPLQPAHRRRRPAYQLYPLLVHARLFGGGYAASAAAAARAALGG